MNNSQLSIETAARLNACTIGMFLELGHNCLKTTELYTHITNKGLIKINSPLDNLRI